ncbi:MAG: tetratricopeptide repeat protein [Candidatus Rokubacteria bacterium]|nr:tetratricopeptide repeat protein [Candidatus Rokubacteria bacterium]
MHGRRICALAVATLALAGCATTMGEGRQALRQGRYAEAATHFEEALVEDPEKTDALIGLGIARYKAGDWDDAIEPLGRVVVREPRSSTARLYLGLAHLRKGDLGPVEEHFGALIAERAGTRVAAQADRALRVLRGQDLPSDDLRAFIAASIEDGAEMERQVLEARQYAREMEFRWRDRYYLYDPYYSRPLFRSRRR